MRDRVGAGEGPRHHPGLAIGPLRPQSIGAGIDGDLGIDAENAAGAIGVSRELVVVVAGMGRGQQMLAAILDPAHRAIELQGQRRHDDFFRVEPRLWSEPAADIGGDDADAALLEIEDLAERDAHRVRRLGRGIDHDLVEPVVATGEHAAAFERRSRLPVHAEFARHGDFGSPRRGLDVAALEPVLEIEIVAPALVHRVAAAAQVAPRVDDRIEHLVIDADPLRQVFRFAAGQRNAGGDRLADIAHLVRGERRPGRRFGAGRVGHDADRLDARQLGRGVDAALRFGRDGNRSQPGMRVGAAQEGHLERPRQLDVGHKLAAAMQMAIVFAARQRRADTPPNTRFSTAMTGVLRQRRCGVGDRRDDVGIAGAAAEVAGETATDLGF